MEGVYWALAVVAVPCALYYYFTRNFNHWKNKNVVTPKFVPFFGNLYESARRNKTLSEVLHGIYNEFPKEKVVGIYRMTTPCLLIRDLDVIKNVMIKDFDIFSDRGVEFSKDGLGANLFHANAETWRVLRSKFTPMFTTGKLRNMLHLMVERGDKFVDVVSRDTAKNQEQDVLSLLQNYFVATISACAFGLDLDTYSDQLKTLKKVDKAIFTNNYFSELDMMYPGILKTLNSSLFPTYVKEFFYKLVSDVMNERGNQPSNRKDFMDLILELKLQGDVQGPKRTEQDKQTHLEITDSVIAAQAFVFYAGGYETSSTTLSFLLYQLALNPHIQTKLQAEIDAVLAKHNGQMTYDALHEMEYLEKVFNETLRMYPVVDLLQRNAQERYTIPGTDVVVEKGQTVLVSAFGVQHDENIWPNPEVFDPERFAPENIGNRHPCAFMAFGVGPRNCIGMRFSKVSSRVCLVKLLSKFSVQPSKNTQLKMKYNTMRLVVSPDGGVLLNVVPRVK